MSGNLVTTAAVQPLSEQAKLNIIYPINGASYPFGDSRIDKLIQMVRIPFSFCSTLAEGPHKIEWGFDNDTVGSGTFCDQIAVHGVYRLMSGWHKFWGQGRPWRRKCRV